MDHVTHFSSNANNGTNASTFYWNVNNSSSNANRNIGTRLGPLDVAKRCSFLASWRNRWPQQHSSESEPLGLGA